MKERTTMTLESPIYLQYLQTKLAQSLHDNVSQNLD